MTQVVVSVDPACGADLARVNHWVQAVDAQAQEFATAWGVPYTPVVLHAWDVLMKLTDDEVTAFIADSRLLTIQPDIDAPGALGFHDDVGGVIFARVKYQGDDTSVTLSHEVLEEMGDPTCDLYVSMPSGKETAREACDAVEGDVYPSPGDPTVNLSNYLQPAWFGVAQGGNQEFDRMGKLSAPFSMIPGDGGYMIIRDAGGNETQVFALSDKGYANAGRKLNKPRGRLARRLRGRMAA